MIHSKHQFLDHSDLNSSNKIMLLGTIHPHIVTSFEIPFFYGNVGSIWKIFKEIFPEFRFDSINEIKRFLAEKDIYITDIIKECSRVKETATSDSDLGNIITNKRSIEDAIKNSDIDTIWFTSGFSKNNAARLFCKEFEIVISRNYDASKRTLVIPESIFGKKVKGIVLYSPSGAANVGISKSKEYLATKEMYKESKSPVAAFRIASYSKLFH